MSLWEGYLWRIWVPTWWTIDLRYLPLFVLPYLVKTSLFGRISFEVISHCALVMPTWALSWSPSKDSTFKISSIIQLARFVWVPFSAFGANTTRSIHNFWKRSLAKVGAHLGKSNTYGMFTIVVRLDIFPRKTRRREQKWFRIVNWKVASDSFLCYSLAQLCRVCIQVSDNE